MYLSTCMERSHSEYLKEADSQPERIDGHKS